MKIEKAMKVVFGLLIGAIGLWISVWQWEDLFPLIQGAAGPIIGLIGLLILALGLSEEGSDAYIRALFLSREQDINYN